MVAKKKENLEEALKRLAEDGYAVKMGWYPSQQRWSAWVRRLNTVPPQEVDCHTATLPQLVENLGALRRVGE